MPTNADSFVADYTGPSANKAGFSTASKYLKFGVRVKADLHSGVGVEGTADAVKGIGVSGFAKNGTGVQGHGATGMVGTGRVSAGNGRGGVFKSNGVESAGPVAQIQLVPAPDRKVDGKPVPASPTELKYKNGLPVNGQAGDLLARVGSDSGECTLWLCTRTRTKSKPAHWRQVLLGSEQEA